MIYRVIANVRKRGAIGIFHSEPFDVEAKVGALRSQIVDAFIAQYGDIWELNHITSFWEMK